MKAVEFVKEFTVFGAKEYLSGATFYKDKLMVFTNIDDLKQIVEAFDLVDRFGGLEKAKEYVDNFLLPELTRSINLVEKCNV